MADDEGVLENLPRSRPGQRSEKRASGGPAKAERGKTQAAKSARGSDPRSSARPKPGGQPDGAERGAASSDPVGTASSDPVGKAIRTVTGLAATGARVANDVAREVVRRLPRP